MGRLVVIEVFDSLYPFYVQCLSKCIV